MRNYKKWLSVIFLLIPFAYSIGQSPHFDILKIIKNKNSVQVNTIFQDNTGFIWIGTDQGLVKYNGIDFTVYTVKNNLASDNISAIAQDSTGNLWLGHENGSITILSNDEFSTFAPEEGTSKSEISSFLVTNTNTTWFSTKGEGVYYWGGKNRKRVYNINTDDGLLDNYVYSITPGEKSNIYISTDKGISIYDTTLNKVVGNITMADGLPDNIVKDIHFTSKSMLWIAMEDGGICCYNTETKKFKHLENWMFGSINDFVNVTSNELWVSTKRNGIIKIIVDANGKPWYKTYEKKQGLLSNKTQTIFIDKEHNIWLGLKEGLMLKKNNRVEFLDNEDDLNLKNVYSLAFDKSGSMWVASQDGLNRVTFSEMGKLIVKKVLENPKFSFLSYLSVYCDSKGYIWAGTYGYGVYRIDPSDLSFKVFTTKDGLANNNVISITGKNDIVLFSTLEGGVSEFNYQYPNKFKSYSIDNGLTSNYVYNSFIDSKDRFWFGTDGGGAAYLSNNKIQKCEDPKDTLFSHVFYSIVEDSKHRIWLSSSDRGIYIYNDSTFKVLNEMNGLRSNDIKSLISTTNGNVVLVSNEGIDVFKSDGESSESLGEEDHVAYLEPSLNAINTSANGLVWFGTQNGVVVFNPNDDSSTIHQPNILITNKQLYSKPIPKGKVKFTHNENYFSFQYIGLWFKAPGKLLYRYKLEGADMDWSPATRTLQANYSNLSSGDYKFVVQVSHSPGKWIGSSNATYSFTIKPPFYFTWWFIVLVIISISIGVYSFIKYRTAKLERDKDILEEEVRKRTHEIQMQKEEIETQRDEIEVQHQYVSKQRDQIAAQNRDIKSSIEYASRIQQAMLPPTELIKENFKEFFIFFNPKDIVSGDFYYINKIDQKLIIAAADCTGHGVPGAIMSMLGLTLLNDVVTSLDNLTAAGILNELRTRIKNSLKQRGYDGDSRDGMDISLCIFDISNRNVNYSGANNPLLLVRNGELLIYSADKMPIGVYIREDSFTDQYLEVKENDMIYLFSDGYQDQLGGVRNTKFLTKNFKALLTELSDKPLNIQRQTLVDRINSWKDGYPQTDDMLVIGLRV